MQMLPFSCTAPIIQQETSRFCGRSENAEQSRCGDFKNSGHSRGSSSAEVTSVCKSEEKGMFHEVVDAAGWRSVM